MQPNLVEPGVKYFINESLIKCKEVKFNLNSTILNISLTLIFIFIVCFTLYQMFKTKSNKEEQNKKKKEKEEYLTMIGHKLNILHKEKQRENNILLTTLPEFKNPYVDKKFI